MSKKRLFFIILLIAALGAGWWYRSHETTADKEKVRPAPGPAPVQIVNAAFENIPIFLSGIGNVASLNNVVIRSQIDGELIKLYFEEGQKVQKGDLLAEIDSRALQAELAQAEAEKSSNKAQLAIAQMDLNRYNALLKDDAIARQIVDQQKATVQRLDAAVQVSQAAIDAVNVRLSYTKIRAPLSGHVGIRRVDPGNIVRASDAEGLITIAQLDPVSVLFAMPQTSLADLMPLLQQEDKPVEIMAKEGGGIIAAGQLQTIDNQIDQTTGTVRLKAVVPNAERKLWPGQFVVARIKVKTLEDKIILPLRAAQRGQGRVFVYRLSGNKAQDVDVKVVFEDETRAAVEGLQAGDKIVIDGQMRLKPGAEVRIAEDRPAAAEKTAAEK